MKRITKPTDKWGADNFRDCHHFIAYLIHAFAEHLRDNSHLCKTMPDGTFIITKEVGRKTLKNTLKFARPYLYLLHEESTTKKQKRIVETLRRVLKTLRRLLQRGEFAFTEIRKLERRAGWGAL